MSNNNSSTQKNGQKITAYDELALKEIHEWKNPELGWFGHAMRTINLPLDKAGDFVFETPVVGDAIKRSMEGFIGFFNDMAQLSVQKETIYAEFRKAGHESVIKESDVFDIELEEVDKIVGWLDAKYKGLALAEGAGFGYMGLPGIPADVVALISLNLRAIGEYATYYGFNINSQKERLFGMNVLALASSPTDKSKVLAMAQLVRIAQAVAKKRTWKELEKHAFVQVFQQIAKAIGIRLTKAKLAQFIPYAGAVVGGGFNLYFTSKVCNAAYCLYRERFLAQKYGADVIEVTVEPAQDIDPGYPEENENIPSNGENCD